MHSYITDMNRCHEKFIIGTIFEISTECLRVILHYIQLYF